MTSRTIKIKLTKKVQYRKMITSWKKNRWRSLLRRKNLSKMKNKKKSQHRTRQLKRKKV